MTPEDLTRTLFDRWSISNAVLLGSLEDTFAPSCVWDQSSMAITRGPDQALRLMRRAKAGMGLETADVEMVSLVTSGEIVHTERVDHSRRADGSLLVSLLVAGVMRWDKGKLVAWREYFDLTSMVGWAVPKMASYGFERIRGVARSALSR